MWVASGFGLGFVPKAPGTAGSLASALLFALVSIGLEGALLPVTYFIVLVTLVPVALWSSSRALEEWKTADPPAIVIDEILGQWTTYSGLLLADFAGWSATEARWKYLVAGFILFRVFDVVKPFPTRRSERLPGAAGVVVDDVLAGLYAGLVLLLLAWRGWLK